MTEVILQNSIRLKYNKIRVTRNFNINTTTVEKSQEGNILVNKLQGNVCPLQINTYYEYLQKFLFNIKESITNFYHAVVIAMDDESSLLANYIFDYYKGKQFVSASTNDSRDGEMLCVTDKYFIRSMNTSSLCRTLKKTPNIILVANYVTEVKDLIEFIQGLQVVVSASSFHIITNGLFVTPEAYLQIHMYANVITPITGFVTEKDLTYNFTIIPSFLKFQNWVLKHHFPN